MNDPLEHVFRRLHAADVPEGPPEELIQATLRSVNEELRDVAISRRMRRRRLSIVAAAAAIGVFGLTLFTLKNSEPENTQWKTASRQPRVKSSTNVASAFIESSHLNAGQTFLLPLGGSAVCIDPATWPNDLLTITSRPEP